jgi:hypothetical protein
MEYGRAAPGIRKSGISEIELSEVNELEGLLPPEQ